jgi:hypothetical protein
MKEGINESARTVPVFKSSDNFCCLELDTNQKRSGANAKTTKVGLLKRPKARSDPIVFELL